MKLLMIPLVLVSMFFSSCTKQEKKADLVIWTSNENVRNALLSLTTEFERDFGKKVQVDILNKDVTTQFKTAAFAGKGPDVLLWAHDVVGELAESGLIEPINITKKDKDQFLKVALDAFTYKGRLYGYPYDLEAVALIYNKDIYPTAPKSFEEIVAKSKKMPKDQYGFLYDFKNFFFSFGMFSAGGGYIFKNNNGTLDINDIGINNKGSIEGVTFLKKLVDDKIIPISTDRSIAFGKMKAGKLGATIDGPWALGDLRKSKINYGIAKLPTLNGHTPRPFVGTHGLIVRRSSPNKDLAKEFIEKYVVTKKGILKLYESDPRGPSRKDALAEIKGDDPDLVAFLDSAADGLPMPNVPEMGAVWGAVGGAIALSVNGKLEVKEALDTAHKQIKTAVSKK